MSIEQFRNLRSYQEAADLEREATHKIAELEAELTRWRGIQAYAQEVGKAALAALPSLPEADHSDTDAPQQ